MLIVGGSLVGLSAALFLRWRGIPSLVVERHPAPARPPRARAINPRTMELLRALELEATIRAARSPLDDNNENLRVESLAGREIEKLFEGAPDDLWYFYPDECFDIVAGEGWRLRVVMV